MKIVKQEVLDFDITPYMDRISPIDYTEPRKPGETAHHLFAYLALNNNNIKIGELGCRWGSSSRIFSINPTNEVYACDISNESINYCKDRPIGNVFYFQKDITLDENINQLLYFDLIFIDIGDHFGITENKIYQFLLKNNYKGVTIWDDIKPPWPMSSWWNSLPQEGRYDVTDIAHGAGGTGIIDFSGELEIL